MLLKPDAVQRSIVGEIISRFERAGLKIIGMKMIQPTKELAEKHYTEEISQRRGAHVREKLMKALIGSTIIAICLEGIHAVEVVRKLVGTTEPKTALPGTIRGDYAHASIAYADLKDKMLMNLVHASGNATEAKSEITVWFKNEELASYKTVNELHVF